MTSDSSWSNKARKITELERPDHVFLSEDDDCYYFGDYTPRKGYAHSATNQFILNLKKPVRHRGEYAWRYKERAIRTGGQLLAATLNRELLNQFVIVPIPPSKPPTHPEYDDRMSRIANNASPFVSCELLSTNEPREPAHHQEGGRSVEGVYATLKLHPERFQGQSTCILIDDVLTTGSSFKACKRKLLEINGIKNVIGFFVARCAWPKIEFEPINFEDL